MQAPTADALSETLRPLTAAPAEAAILCDIDGTLAPIVARPEQAHVPEETSVLLGRLGRRFGCVACISGRPATEARRLVGVGSVAYAGSHGAEVLGPGATRPNLLSAFASWEPRVRAFALDHDSPELRTARVRIEDKGAIFAFHWRGAPDEDAARTLVEGIAAEAEAAGFVTHWGRLVLEVRPPVPVDKGIAVRDILGRAGVRTALFGGDDATDLDAFDALSAMAGRDELDAVVRVGVRSAEGPAAITERADLVVDGVPGFVRVLEALQAAADG